MVVNYQWKSKIETVEENLNKIYRIYEKKMKSDGMAFLIEDGSGKFIWERETGALLNNHKFAIASVTKMYTTTVIMNLIDENIITLDTKISDYLPDSIIKGLHIYKGKDYSYELSVRHLISHTSGLPDYYTEKTKDNISIEKQFKLDPEISFEEALELTKMLKPKFIPGTKGKAYYSDINFDLLGKLIEEVTKETIESNFDKYIFKPLNLKSTYVYKKKMLFDFPGVYVKDDIYKVPNLLAGWPASGSIVSNKLEMMIFLKAFWSGKLFSNNHIENMKVYNYIQFYPTQYGIGNMKYKMIGTEEIIGHSGSTGVLSFYVPKYDIYIVGCINEANMQKATRIVLRLAACFK